MIGVIKSTFFMLILLLGFDLYGQDKDPYTIIDNMKVQLDLVHDYSADLEIIVDVEFIKIPVKHIGF